MGSTHTVPPLWINEKACEYLEQESCTVIIKLHFTHLQQYVGDYEASSETEMIIRCSCESETVSLSHTPVPSSFCRGIISLSLLFPAPLQSWGGIPTISALSQNVLRNYSSFLRGLWLQGLQRVLQEGMWEFESFQICHPSHVDKLLGQLKQDHIHTPPVTWVQPFVPQHLSVLFYCSACQQKGEMLTSEPFVSVCAFLDVLMSLHCFHLAL